MPENLPPLRLQFVARPFHAFLFQFHVKTESTFLSFFFPSRAQVYFQCFHLFFFPPFFYFDSFSTLLVFLNVMFFFFLYGFTSPSRPANGCTICREVFQDDPRKKKILKYNWLEFFLRKKTVFYIRICQHAHTRIDINGFLERSALENVQGSHKLHLTSSLKNT